MTSKPILNEAGQFYRTLSLREADSLTADQWAKYQNWIRDLINNPPHACESCGSQVEFPGLIYCARCQRSKSRRAAEVQAAAEPHKPMQNYLVQASHSAVFAKSDEQLLDEAYPIPDTPHTSVMERCNLQRAAMQRGLTAARSVPAAPVSTAAATTASASGELAECAECDGQGCRHYPDGEWQGKCDGCKGTGIDNRATDGQQGASRAVESPEQQEITLQLALQKLRREHPHLEHSDQRAVRKFATAMEAKMAVSRGKGRSGWQTCSVSRLHGMLLEHLRKGDPVDVANFCMMLWNRGEKVVAK